MQKVVVFMDFANINRAAHDQRIHIDYIHLLNEYLANQDEGRALQAASAYVPIDPRNEHGHDAYIKTLWEAGFVVKSKVGTIAGDTYKCNLDVEMVMDIMKSIYEIKPDILVLASGDVDFVPMILELRNSGIYVEVAGFTNNTSSLLRERANSFINLDVYYDEYYSNNNAQDAEDNSDDQEVENDSNDQETENHEDCQENATMFKLPGQQ